MHYPIMGCESNQQLASEQTSLTPLSRPATGCSSFQLAQSLGVASYHGAAAQLDQARISTVADELLNGSGFDDFHPTSWDELLFWNGNGTPAERAQFYTIGNAINFRFWDLDGQRLTRSQGSLDGQGFAGAMYMWRALKRALDHGQLPVLDAQFLAQLDEDQFRRIFQDDHGQHPLAPGQAERIANLRNLGQVLERDFAGQALTIAEMAGPSLAKFAQLSARCRAFDDPVYKLPMLNAIMLSGGQVHSFADQPLPAIDYHLVRHAVRQGMVIPEAGIDHKLRTHQLLTTREGHELRSACLDAFLQLCQQTGMSGEVIDNKYWHNRNICTDPPKCDECPFVASCAQQVEYGLPLEITRYY